MLSVRGTIWVPMARSDASHTRSMRMPPASVPCAASCTAVTRSRLRLRARHLHRHPLNHLLSQVLSVEHTLTGCTAQCTCFQGQWELHFILHLATTLDVWGHGVRACQSSVIPSAPDIGYKNVFRGCTPETTRFQRPKRNPYSCTCQKMTLGISKHAEHAHPLSNLQLLTPGKAGKKACRRAEHLRVRIIWPDYQHQDAR